MADKASGCGKWLAGIAAGVLVSVLAWSLTHPGGPLNQPTPIPPPPEPSPTPPHAPLLESNGIPLYEERLLLFDLQAGEQRQINIMDIWLVPLVEPPSCASGFMVMSWIVRDPYPSGGEELQILRPIHSAGGKTEQIGSGQSGMLNLGYCDEIYLFNHSLQPYKVEIRYASGVMQ